GVISAPVAALTKGALNAMLVSKLKTVAAVFLAVCLIATGAGLLAQGALAHKPAEGAAASPPQDKTGPRQTPAEGKSSPAGQPEKARPGEKKDITVTGRILDADGKPLADAQVALLGAWMPERRDGNYKEEVRVEGEGVLAQGKTDR